VAQKAYAGGHGHELTDGRYRRRKLPFNATPANGKVGWRSDIPDFARS
jgi:hypothetical protein